jgi:large repetitive protein
VDSNVATMTVTVVAVNDAPVAVPDTATTALDTAVAINVLANDTDVDGGTRTIAGVTPGANGTAVISGSQIMFTPNSGFVGTATFAYQVTDGQAVSNSATVTVTVTGANQPPIAGGPSTVAAVEDTPISISLIGSDPDGQAITFSIFTVPGHGPLVRSRARRSPTPRTRTTTARTASPSASATAWELPHRSP